MSKEVWTEVYARLTELIEDHRTTLVFVNTRRMAERVARELTDRLGEKAVTAHHGSIAKELRLSAEQRLKQGELRALVATPRSSLGSTSATSISFVRSVRRARSRPSCSALAVRVTRSAARPRGGCFRSRATIWSSARPLSTASVAGSLIA